MRSICGNRFAVSVLSAGVAISLLSQDVAACPFCLGSQQLTLRERIQTPDASVLVEWRTGERGDLDRDVPDSTTFDVLKVWRGDVEAGEPLTIDRYQEGRAGDRFLLIGNTLEDVVRWDRAIPLSAVALQYVHALPASEASIGERLRHAFRHLESADTTIANDAFTIVAGAKYEDLAAERDHLVVADLRKWVHDPQTHVTRLGVYGMLLGLTGSPEDIALLRRKIFVADQNRPIRIGIDGVIGGYLLLAGADGLSELDQVYLQNSDVTQDNLYSVTSALRFMWEYGDGLISKARLRQSMRLGLNHEATLELTIVDLARWQDWTLTDRLMTLYQDDATDAFVRRAIIRFLLVAADADWDGLSADEQAAVQRAGESLETIRETDPVLYRRAERGFIRPATEQTMKSKTWLGFGPRVACSRSWGC